MGAYTIAKRFDFCASHQLDGLPDDHPCSRLHGHNYAVEVEITSRARSLDDVGFVVDYRALDPFKRWIDDQLDHRHLNDVVGFNPTAERLAWWLHAQAVSLLADLPGADVDWSIAAVRVMETPKTVAEYRVP